MYRSLAKTRGQSLAKTNGYRITVQFYLRAYNELYTQNNTSTITAFDPVPTITVGNARSEGVGVL